MSEIDLGPLMGSSDRTVKAVARAVTITDSDTGLKDFHCILCTYCTFLHNS